MRDTGHYTGSISSSYGHHYNVTNLFVTRETYTEFGGADGASHVTSNRVGSRTDRSYRPPPFSTISSDSPPETHYTGARIEGSLRQGRSESQVWVGLQVTPTGCAGSGEDTVLLSTFGHCTHSVHTAIKLVLTCAVRLLREEC